MVCCYNPDDMRTAYRAEGKIPVNPPSASVVEYYRKVIRKDIFSHPGFLSQGQEWLDFRSTINPDLMKKKCMMIHLNDMESIANELIDVFEREKDEENKICIKPGSGFLKRWALESVAFIFMGARLGTLKENVEENSDGMMLIKHVDTFYHEWTTLISLPPIWKYISVPYYKRYDEANEGILKIGMKYLMLLSKMNPMTIPFFQSSPRNSITTEA